MREKSRSNISGSHGTMASILLEEQDVEEILGDLDFKVGRIWSPDAIEFWHCTL